MQYLKKTFNMALTLTMAMYIVILPGCGSKQQQQTEATKPAGDSSAQAEDTEDYSAIFQVQDTASQGDDIPAGSVKADEYHEELPAEADDPGNFEQVLAGHLEKKNGDFIFISMYLKGENGNMTGKYFYENTSAKEDIMLRGNLEGDSLMLVEFDPKNRITGRFNGKYVSPNAIEGTWSTPDGKKQLVFRLKYDDMAYDQRKIIGLKADPETE